MHNRITPSNAPVIDLNSNICVIKDHMPPLIYNFSDNIKDNYQSNTIPGILNDIMPHVDTLIFNDYHYIDGFSTYKVFYTDGFFNYQVFDYLSLEKQHNIDFINKTKKFNYISNKAREPRLLTSCWIANNYKNYSEFNYTQSYNYEDFNCVLDKFINEELLKLASIMLPANWISSGVTNDPNERKFIGNKYGLNNYNFYNIIENQVTPTVFSIVMEPVFWENGCMLTEKYINAILGGTIPIVNGYRIYEIINEMGFDTFADIIDTSAQHETNSTLRIMNLLENNKKQIDNAMTIIKDKTIQKRIVNNIKILENYDYNLAKSRYPSDVVEFLEQSVYK